MAVGSRNELAREHASSRPAAADLERYLRLKRAFDILVCLSILPLVIIAIGVVALAILLDSPGPVFFVQPRVGKDGRPFRMVKFRTMQHHYDASKDRAAVEAYIQGRVADGDEDGSTLPHKPAGLFAHRTRVGRLLRKSSLDELPQIWNVLRGDMSLVGPRPNMLSEVEHYAPWHRQRLAAVPGITGLAQINGRSSLAFDTIVEYDLEYIRKRSFTLDLAILFRTAGVVLKENGAG